MRPSRLFLGLALLALFYALLAVVAPFLPVSSALLPFALLVILFLIDWLMSAGAGRVGVEVNHAREVFIAEIMVLHLKLVRPPQAKSVTGTISLCDGFDVVRDFPFRNGTADAELKARRRGEWTIENLWLHWNSRFGLIEFAPVRQINCKINVVPNIRMITSGEIDLKLRSDLFGGKQTQWRGEGSEFHQLSEYVQGMDPRAIAWKHSARERSLVVREMRAERNHQIIMALDNGHLMREEIGGLTKLDHNINAALATTWAAVQGGDLAGLFAFDARPRFYSPPLAGRKTFSRLRSEMAHLRYKSVETNHTLALSSLHHRLLKRSLIIVFTDFVDPLSAQLLLEHLAILVRHHVVVYVSLSDPYLRRIADGNVSTMTEIARSVSAASLLAERRAVLEKMSSMGVFVIETSPGNLSTQLINTYLSITARELI